MYRSMLKNGEFSPLTNNSNASSCPFKSASSSSKENNHNSSTSTSKASTPNSVISSNKSPEISPRKWPKAENVVVATSESSNETTKTEKYNQAREMITAILGRIKGENEKTTRQHFEQIARLSDKQRDIIMQTFPEIEKDPVKNGLKIFIKLLSEHPKYKTIWPNFRAIPDSSLMHAIELRRHASVYMCGLRSIIDSMHNENELAEQLNRIAKAHIKHNVQRKHVFNMLKPVLDIVKECNGNQLSNEMKEAWTVLYEVISNLIEIYRHKGK